MISSILSDTFVQLANTLPMIVWVSDGDSDPFINDRWFEYVGRSRGDEEALVWTNFLHPDDVENFVDLWSRAMAEGTEFAAEARARRHDDEYRWFYLRSVPQRRDGRVVWFGSATDIHETVLLRLESSRSLARFQRTIDSIRDSFFALDASNRCTIANAPFLDLLGLERDQLEDRDIIEAFPEDVRSVVVDMRQDAVRTKSPQTGQIEFAEIDREFAIRIFPNDDETAYFLTDVTEEARTQRELRRSEERFRLLARESSELVWELDFATGEVWTSADPAAIFGPEFVPASSARESWIDVVHPDDRAEVERGFLGAVEQGEATWSTVFRIAMKEGTRHFRTKAALIYSEEGVPLRAIGATVDVTDEIRLEQHALRAQRTETVGRLAGGVAHDLNNVLSPILVTASLLKELMPTPEFREDLELIETSARRGSRMIERLLAFARGTETELEVVDTMVLVFDALQLLRETIPTNIEFETNLKPALYVKGDETQLHQVLANLVVNARDAMPEGGTLTISSDIRDLPEAKSASSKDELPASSYAVIEVSDTGHGIAPEHLDDVFDPYFTTKEMGKGTGLGLSTSMGILERHDGFLTVDSIVGQGTTFEIFLPLATADDLRDTSPVLEKIERDVSRDSLILVIDDEPTIRGSIGRLLEVAGYRVQTASNGLEGLSRLEQSPNIDLVITDVMMPTMSGDQMARTIREEESDVPIIALSGHVDPERRAEMERYADVFLAKPVSADELLHEVSLLLADTPGEPAPVRTPGDTSQRPE